jgi:hypothetical protein
VRDAEAEREEQLGQITQAALGAQAPPHDLQDGVRGEGQVSEGRAGARMKGPAAGLAAEAPLAKLRTAWSFAGADRRTVGTGHQ